MMIGTSLKQDGQCRLKPTPDKTLRGNPPDSPHSVVALGLSLLFGVATGPAGLAEEAERPLQDLSMEELLEVRIDTVFGASRRSQKTWEAPASVSLVSREEIQTFGYRTLAEVLQSVPGFYSSNDRNYTYLGVRGFSRPGDYNSRVLLLIDGHRANDNIYDAAYFGQDALVDIDMVERVEVIRGPSSSLYGSSAVLGVINVITRPGSQFNGVEASAEAGGFGTYKGRVTAGQKFESGLEFVASGSFYESEGPGRLYYPEFDDPATQNGVTRGLDWERAGNFLGRLSYGDVTLAVGLVRRTKGVPTAAYEAPFNDPRVRTTDQTVYADVGYAHEFAQGLHVSARLSYHRYTYSGDYPYDVAYPGDPPQVVLNRDEAVGESWAAELVATQELYERLTLTGGAEVRDNFRQDQLNFDAGNPPTVYTDSREHGLVAAVFGQAEYAIRSDLLVSAGLRYDHYSTVGGSANPRAGLNYRPWENTTFKLLYGRAFRAPNASELSYVAPGAQGNAGLRPETDQTWEAVVEQTLWKTVRLSASGFYYRLDDLIEIRSVGGVTQAVNLQAADSLGTELALENQWGHGWLGRVSFTAQRAEDRATGEELTNSPRRLAKFHLRAPLIRDRLFAAAEVQYVGTVRAVQSGRVDDYWITNLTLLSRELVPGLELSGGVYNVFDQDFAITGFEEHRQRLIPQNGRSFRVKLTYRF